jgi:hypothetical protein
MVISQVRIGLKLTILTSKNSHPSWVRERLRVRETCICQEYRTEILILYSFIDHLVVIYYSHYVLSLYHPNIDSSKVDSSSSSSPPVPSTTSSESSPGAENAKGSCEPSPAPAGTPVTFML